jgi:molecular chaperone GrpE
MPKRYKPPLNKWAKFAEKQQEEDDETFEVEMEMTDTPDELDEVEDIDVRENADASDAGIEFPSRQNIEDDLTDAEQKADEAKEKMLAAYAELENVRKLSARDVQNAHRYGNEKILTELLPVIDSLTRAIEGEAPQDKAAKAMHDGIELTLDMFEKTLTKFGVEVIAPEKGDTFNPEQHEAMSMVPESGVDTNCIVQVLQKGYLLNGRVLRAAMVMVAQ